MAYVGPADRSALVTCDAAFVALNQVKAVAAGSLVTLGASVAQLSVTFDTPGGLPTFTAIPMYLLQSMQRSEPSSVYPHDRSAQRLIVRVVTF